MSMLMFLLAMSTISQAQKADRSHAEPNRAAVVTALHHQEGLVKTLRADYERVMLPTPPQQAARIRKAFGKNAEKYLFETDFVKHHSGSYRFWRKGGKQRNEWTTLAASDRSRSAFDGQIMRSVREGADVTAAISTAETGDWYKMPREDPIAFLFLHYERPFSELVAEAVGFSSALVHRGDERLYRVTVRCAPKGEEVLEFLFDQRLRQLERVCKFMNASTPSRLVDNHKLVFSAYKTYETPSGETITFPERVTVIGYAMDGVEPDGTQLEVTWTNYHFTKVEFNIDMPDSLFDLEIPKGARINDLVTGAGWLSPGKRPATLVPAEAWSRRLWIGLAVLSALLVVTAAVFWKRRRNVKGV